MQEVRVVEAVFGRNGINQRQHLEIGAVEMTSMNYSNLAFD